MTVPIRTIGPENVHTLPAPAAEPIQFPVPDRFRSGYGAKHFADVVRAEQLVRGLRFNEERRAWVRQLSRSTEDGSTEAAVPSQRAAEATVQRARVTHTLGEMCVDAVSAPKERRKISGQTSRYKDQLWTPDELAQRLSQKGLDIRRANNQALLQLLTREAHRRERVRGRMVDDQGYTIPEPSEKQIVMLSRRAKHRAVILERWGELPLFGLRLGKGVSHISRDSIDQLLAYYGDTFLEDALAPALPWQHMQRNFRLVAGNWLDPNLTDDQLHLAYTAYRLHDEDHFLDFAKQTGHQLDAVTREQLRTVMPMKPTELLELARQIRLRGQRELVRKRQKAAGRIALQHADTGTNQASTIAFARYVADMAGPQPDAWLVK